MILVDTSVWIYFFKSKQPNLFNSELIQKISTCPIIIQEVFQGLKDNNESEKFKEHFLAIPRFSDPTPIEDFLLASDIYRSGRKRGLTIRSSTDCLIAAIAIKNKLTLWHKDRDFNSICKYTDLKIYS